MNYIIKLLSLSILGVSSLVAGSFNKAAIAKKGTISTDDIYGAFDGQSDANVVLLIRTPRDGMILNVNYYNNKTSALVISENINIVIHGTLSEYKLNYKLMLKNRLTDSGLRVSFAVILNENIISSCEILLYPKVSKSINGFDYTTHSYEIYNRTFGLKESRPVCTYESFNFYCTDHSIYLNDDYSLFFGDSRFDYENGSYEYNELGSMAYYLRIEDKNNLFKYIEKDIDGYINIPIDIYQEEECAYFNFINNMYVDTSTLEMSLVSRPYFTATNKFYINPDILKKISNSKIEIYMSKVGRNETDITLPLELDSSLNFMGMCFDSQYCFEGGIRA